MQVMLAKVMKRREPADKVGGSGCLWGEIFVGTLERS